MRLFIDAAETQKELTRAQKATAEKLNVFSDTVYRLIRRRGPKSDPPESHP